MISHREIAEMDMIYKERGEATDYNGRNETGFIKLIWTGIVCGGSCDS